MKFIVEWKKTAIDELTAAWTSADSSGRREITAAAREIDQLLQFNPQAHGESREDDRRIMFVAPLAVAFRVDIDSLQVDVLRVWRIKE